jgi:hemolysin activation/secretion protein
MFQSTLPLPWLSQDAQDGWMQLAPFFDAGWSTNTDDNTPSPETIYSAGLGLRWDSSPRVHSEFYWGHPLNSSLDYLNINEEAAADQSACTSEGWDR